MANMANPLSPGRPFALLQVTALGPPQPLPGCAFHSVSRGSLQRDNTLVIRGATARDGDAAALIVGCRSHAGAALPTVSGSSVITR